LNFANGIHPGGGFLTGANAQDEAISRILNACSWIVLSVGPAQAVDLTTEHRIKGIG
jgi:hypothetical protein